MAYNDTLTPNLKLVKVAADRRNWTQQMNKNLAVIDAAISAYFNINNLQGVWQNSTAYAAGQAVVDEESAVVYVNLVAHTSATVPSTFAEDREAHPSYWSVYSSPARSRGVWTSNTAYALNDFVVSGAKYAICIQAHTSGASFQGDVDGGKWSVLVDLSSAIFVADPTGNPNKFAVTNADATAYDLASASVAADLLGFTSASKPLITMASVSEIAAYIGVQGAPSVYNGMTAAEIRALIVAHNVVIFPEPIILSDPLDLRGLQGKTLISYVSGQPLITTTASVGMYVGGSGTDFHGLAHAPQFYGEWFIAFSGTRLKTTRAIVISKETYRLHFDCLWFDNWGGCMEATEGDVRTITVNRLKLYNFATFGVRIFSRNAIKEMDSFFCYEVEGNTDDPLADGCYFEFGPSMGSAGKIGAEIKNGILYRQEYVARFWAVEAVESYSWSGGILTILLRHYHSFSEGDDVYIGDTDVTAVNNVSGAAYTALSGTTEKTIRIAMAVDPGTITVKGYVTYSADIAPRAFNNFERSRKITFYKISGRGQLKGGFRVEDGGNVVWYRCIVDDSGISDPYGLDCTATWAAGIATFKTWVATTPPTYNIPADHELSVGDLFNTRYFTPYGYNFTGEAATIVDANTVQVPMTDDPGTMTSAGSYYKPVQHDADAWYFGPNASAYILKECEAHEEYRSAVYDDRMTNERSVIENCRFFNQAYGAPNPPDPVADCYFRPGRRNMTVRNNIFGAGDTWGFSSRSFRLTGIPVDGDYVSIQKNADTAPRFFIFAATADPDASQPNVEIGATIAECCENLATAINNDDHASSNAVQAFATNEYRDDAVATDRVLLVRTVPGAVGNDCMIAKSSSAITITPAGTTLGGGTGNATASYGIMNIRNGEHGNIVEGNQMESHTIAETNMPEDEEPVTSAANIIDNADFSIDQWNEGAAATVTSSSVGTRSVDRWKFTRSTSGSDPTVQRVAGDGRTYALRMTGAAGVSAIIGRHRIEGARGAAQVGKVHTYSIEAKSATVTKLFLRIAVANALDDFTSVTQVVNKQFIINSTIDRYSISVVMPAGAANGVQLEIRCTDAVPLAAGGSLDVQAIKFEESVVVTEFTAPSPSINLRACQIYLRKSFPTGTVPAENAGVAGAVTGVQTIAGAVSQTIAAVTFTPPMWAAPTVTLYNPSATNAQARNTTTSADWSATSAGTPTAAGMTITGTGAGGSSVGNDVAVHYVADADPA